MIISCVYILHVHYNKKYENKLYHNQILMFLTLIGESEFISKILE